MWIRALFWWLWGLILWGIVGCTSQVSYQPPVVPLKVSVGTQGVQVSVEPELETPIGTFAWEVGVPVLHFVENHKTDWRAERVLAVRVDGTIYVYKLKPGVHFSFDPSVDERYYRRVALYYDPSDPEGDIILELETITAAEIVATHVAQEPSNSGVSGSPGGSLGYPSQGLSTSPALQPSPTPSACRYSPKRLQVSHQAIVCTYHSHEPVFLREEPSKYSSFTKRLATGAVVTVLAGPVCDEASGWWYWKVRTLHGYEGWMAEGGDEKDPYFLCPYP